MPNSDSTDHLLLQIIHGEDEAVNRLLERYRPKLRRMIEVYLDPRVAARADASDVVQEALAEAAIRLPEFARQTDFPFYPWLRNLAWERVLQLHRRHIGAAKRSVNRESLPSGVASEHSVWQLAKWVTARESSPSERKIREERSRALIESLQLIPGHYREIVVLRHIEELKFEEIAVILKLGMEAVRSRYRRALERLQTILEQQGLELS
ncbi:MAG: sigma-70 family RNA polymerase sigma factor [Planctomycetaceae bacterium]|nr:sigma-70 family RNA polymerase sigma factor [Planctomycetaceae bacterium]